MRNRGWGLVAATMMAAMLGPGPAAARAPQAAVLASSPRNGASAQVGSAGWASTNWSGYARSGGPYTSVTGSWVVPAVSRTKRPTYSSSWIGIDGYTNSSLIQTGTEHDYYGGAAHYFSWWEILPAPETRVPITPHPGDHMTASISHGGGGLWTISITDTTTGQSFSTQQSYSGSLNSVEWITEAPFVNGQQATLAHYSPMTFDPGTANGISPALQPADSGAMVQGGKTVSTPSAPDAEHDGFNLSYGAATPSPPAS